MATEGHCIFTHRSLSIFSLVELVLSVFGAVWAFIVSVVITAGLDETCKAFSDANNRPDNFPYV